jgi:hypothetical protein
MLKLLASFLMAAVLLPAQEWKPLLNGKDLDGWEKHGPCEWSYLSDGIILGQRTHENRNDPFGPWPAAANSFHRWLNQQAWLYTKAEYRNFDLHVEYLIPPGGNSGVSIRDASHGRYAAYEEPVPAGMKDSTPAHIGYEIQIIDDDREKFPTGSIYTFVPGKTGLQKPGAWNTLEIESRADLIRVRVNGQIAAEYPGDPKRAKSGPIGLQLHDQFTFAMFRNIRIRELP